MILTNKTGLPDTFYRAVKRHTHRGGDYSASMLHNPVRQVLLVRRHDQEIEEDVSDRIWALLGTAVHYILEKAEGAYELVETYLEQEFLPNVTVSGTVDHYIDGTISDYKVTSAWSVLFGSRIPDWESQLNVYAFLFRQESIEVNQLQVVAILRDWSRKKAYEDMAYPQGMITVVPIRLWTYDEQYEYIMDRVEGFESYKDVPDDELPFCTDEERWKDPAKFAVMKNGRKSALRVLDSEGAARQYLDEKCDGDPKCYIEKRPSVARRCADYCAAAPFCNQYQGEL